MLADKVPGVSVVWLRRTNIHRLRELTCDGSHGQGLYPVLVDNL